MFPTPSPHPYPGSVLSCERGVKVFRGCRSMTRDFFCYLFYCFMTLHTPSRSSSLSKNTSWSTGSTFNLHRRHIDNRTSGWKFIDICDIFQSETIITQQYSMCEEVFALATVKRANIQTNTFDFTTINHPLGSFLTNT